MAIRQGFTVENGADVESAFAFAADRGFEFLELNMDHQFDRRRVDTAWVGALAERYDLSLLVHLPYRLDVGTPLSPVREGSCRELEASIDAAVEMGAEKGVFHAQTRVKAEKWDHGMVRECLYDSVERMTEHARERGFEACVENVKSAFFDAGDFPDLFRRTGASACLDTGHAHVTGTSMAGQADLVREHGDRISHVHLNDMRGDDFDEHLPVGVGKLDFSALAEAIREAGWEGTLTHEVFTFDNEPRAFGKARFDELVGAPAER
jgi:sugar phosphate isomerase/epimerase